MAALSRKSKNVCRAIRKELYFIYFSLLVEALEGWPRAVLWYYYLVSVVLVCSENGKKWAYVVFVNAARDLVLVSKVQKACHLRSSLFLCAEEWPFLKLPPDQWGLGEGWWHTSSVESLGERWGVLAGCLLRSMWFKEGGVETMEGTNGFKTDGLGSPVLHEYQPYPLLGLHNISSTSRLKKLIFLDCSVPRLDHQPSCAALKNFPTES